MSEPAKKKATYEDLYTIPDNTIGEIINGELIVTPRPSRRHIGTASALGYRIGPPYQFGEGGGPGGWIIPIEPEIGLGGDTSWSRTWQAGKEKDFRLKKITTGFPLLPTGFVKSSRLTPPASIRPRKCRFMPDMEFPAHGWDKTLDVYRVESGKWYLSASHGGRNQRVRAEPFQAIEFHLADLWIENSWFGTLLQANDGPAAFLTPKESDLHRAVTSFLPSRESKWNRGFQSSHSELEPSLQITAGPGPMPFPTHGHLTSYGFVII